MIYKKIELENNQTLVIPDMRDRLIKFIEKIQKDF